MTEMPFEDLPDGAMFYHDGASFKKIAPTSGGKWCPYCGESSGANVWNGQTTKHFCAHKRVVAWDKEPG